MRQLLFDSSTSLTVGKYYKDAVITGDSYSKLVFHFFWLNVTVLNLFFIKLVWRADWFAPLKKMEENVKK